MNRRYVHMAVAIGVGVVLVIIAITMFSSGDVEASGAVAAAAAATAAAAAAQRRNEAREKLDGIASDGENSIERLEKIGENRHLNDSIIDDTVERTPLGDLVDEENGRT